MSNFMEIRPLGAELFHANRWTDRQTDRHDEANIILSQFGERRLKTEGAKGNVLNITKSHHRTWIFNFLNLIMQISEHENGNCPLGSL